MEPAITETDPPAMPAPRLPATLAESDPPTALVRRGIYVDSPPGPDRRRIDEITAKLVLALDGRGLRRAARHAR